MADFVTRHPLTDSTRSINVDHSSRPATRKDHGSDHVLGRPMSALATLQDRKPSADRPVSPLRPPRPYTPDLPNLDRCISIMFHSLENHENEGATSDLQSDAKLYQQSKHVSRPSRMSAASGRSETGQKLYIGPWNLGKNLGAGSSARVRLCRHKITHQLAAVKIVSKHTALLVQAGSLAALHTWDTSRPPAINGELRVPMTIEREVAMLQLIDHPNIIKLYDIWENRKEM